MTAPWIAVLSVLALLLMCIHDLQGQVHRNDSCYRFQLVDSATGKPLAGSMARTVGGMHGGYASKAGVIRICDIDLNAKLELRSIGYRTDTVKLSQLLTMPQWPLTPSSLQLPEVIVMPDASAKHIVTMVAKGLNKKKRATAQFSYSLYSIIERRSKVGKTKEHSARETVSTVNVTNGDTTSTRINVIAERTLGTADTSSDAPVYDEELDQTSEFIEIRGHRYPFPLSVEGANWYDYEFVVRQDGTRCGTEISFTPRTPGAPGFAGRVTVCEADTAFASATYRLINAKNLPFVETYEVYQRYDHDHERLWFPVYQQITAELRVAIITGVATGRFTHTSTRTMIDVTFDSLVSVDPSNVTYGSMNANQRRSIAYQIDSAKSDEVLRDRTVLTDSIIRQLSDIGRKTKPDTSSFDADEDGLLISSGRGTDLRLLPLLFRSQSRQLGWGAGLTIGQGANRYTLTYGRAKDESIYGARCNLGLQRDSHSNVRLEAEYLSTVVSIQQPFTGNSNGKYKLLATAYPGCFHYCREQSASTGVYVTSDDVQLSAKGAYVKMSTRSPLIDSLESTVRNDLNSLYLISETGFKYSNEGFRDGKWSDDLPVEIQLLARIGYRPGSSDPFMSGNIQLATGINLLRTALGDVRLSGELRAGSASTNTPANYTYAFVPRFTFGGSLSDHVTLMNNSIYTHDMVGARLELDLDDLPWRILGLPSVNGISPRFSLTANRSELYSVKSYTSVHSPPRQVRIVEAGIRLRSIPLLFTSLVQLEVAASWCLNTASMYQSPFRIVFDVSWPFDGM